MSQHNLSDLIDSLHESWTAERFNMLLAKLKASSVGIIAINVPDHYLGKTVRTASEGVTLASTRHGDGKSRILAFAEPRDFVAKFGPKCNGEMLGAEVIKVVLHNPDCAGILLNSAKSEISIVIERDALITTASDT